MKRRNLVLGTAGFAGSIVTGFGRAAEPCPPSPVVVGGGTSASTACPSAPGNTYTTNFAGTENPISEGGKWINGKAVGLDWNNVQTVPGKAFGAQFVDLVGISGRYSDPIAHLNTSFTANQYAQGTVFRAGGYGASGPSHEIELLLRFRITARSARGYEVLISRDNWVIIVRWNGPLGNYTELASTGGPISSAIADGDVIRAEIIGSVIRVYRNSALVLTGPSNTTWTDGQPGVGFWPTPGSTLASYGWRSFSAGSL